MKTVAFFGTCSARSEKVLVSGRIATPFRLKEIHATFADGCVDLVFLRFYLAADDQAPSSGKPSGVSVLEEYGHVDYVVGNATKKVLAHEIEVPQGGAYLKVHADNQDYYDHVVDVQMFLEPMERK